MSSCNGAGKESSASANSDLSNQVPLLHIKEEPVYDDECQSKSSENDIQFLGVVDRKKGQTSQTVTPVYTIKEEPNEFGESCSFKTLVQRDNFIFKHPTGVPKTLSPIPSVAPVYRRQCTKSQHLNPAFKTVNHHPVHSNHKELRSPLVPGRQPLNRDKVKSVSKGTHIQNVNISSKDTNCSENLPAINRSARSSYGDFAPSRNFSDAGSFHSAKDSHAQSLNVAGQQAEISKCPVTSQNQRAKGLTNLCKAPIRISDNCARTEQNESGDSLATVQRQVQQLSIPENVNELSLNNISSVPENQCSASNIADVPPTSTSASVSTAKRKIPKEIIRHIEADDSAGNKGPLSVNESQFGCKALTGTTFNIINDSNHSRNCSQDHNSINNINQCGLSTELKNYNNQSEKGRKYLSVSEKSPQGEKLINENTLSKTTPVSEKSGSTSEPRFDNSQNVNDFSTVKSKKSCRKAQKPRRVQNSSFNIKTHLSDVRNNSPRSDNCRESTKQLSESYTLNTAAERERSNSQCQPINLVGSADGNNGLMGNKADPSNNFGTSNPGQFEEISSASEDSTSLGASPHVSRSIFWVIKEQFAGSNSLTDNCTKTLDPFIPDSVPAAFHRHRIRDFETNYSGNINSQEILRQLIPNYKKSCVEKENSIPINHSIDHRSIELNSIPENSDFFNSETVNSFLLSPRLDNYVDAPNSSTIVNLNSSGNDLPQIVVERNDSYQNRSSQVYKNNIHTTHQTESDSFDTLQRKRSFNEDTELHAGRSHAEIFTNSEAPPSRSRTENNETNDLSSDATEILFKFDINLHCVSEKGDCMYTPGDSKYYSFNLREQFILRNNFLLKRAVNDGSSSSSSNDISIQQQDRFPTYDQFYERYNNFVISPSQDVFEFKLIVLEIRGCNPSGFEYHSLNENQTAYECENFWLSFEILQPADVKRLIELIDSLSIAHFETSESVHETRKNDAICEPNSILYFWPAAAFISQSEVTDQNLYSSPLRPIPLENAATIATVNSKIFISFTNLSVNSLAQVVSSEPKFADLFEHNSIVPEDNVMPYTDDSRCNDTHILNEITDTQNNISSFHSWQNETNLVPNESFLNYATEDSDEVIILEEISNTNNFNREKTTNNFQNSPTIWNINRSSDTQGNHNSGASSLAGSPHVQASENFDFNPNADGDFCAQINYSSNQIRNNNNDASNTFFHHSPVTRQESLEPVNNQSSLNEQNNKQGLAIEHYSYEQQHQIPDCLRDDNSANTSSQDNSNSVNNPHFMLHSFHIGRTNTKESTTFIGNPTWNQHSDNDRELQNFHRPEFGMTHAMSAHQSFGLISSRQADIDDINKQQAIGVLQRYVNRYELDNEHHNPQWGILSRSNEARPEPIKAHNNRGGAHRRWTSRQGNDRCFLQTSGGNIVQDDMASHTIYRNVNYEFPTFPDQHTARNLSLIGDGTKHVSSCPSTNFSQSINPDFSDRPLQGTVIPHIRRQCHTFINPSHPTPIPSLPNDSLNVLQREEESPQNNSETQSLSSPYSVVHDLSINENYSVPEADNLFQNSQTLANFGTPDSGTYSNSETEMHHESVSRPQHRSDVVISSNMQSANPLSIDDQTLLMNEINQAIYEKNEIKLGALLPVVLKLNNTPQILRIHAHLALYRGQYDEVIRIIKSPVEMFPLVLHKELQTLWLQAWESLDCKKFQEHPKPKTKEKHPFPETIYVDTQKVLNEAYEKDQYPKFAVRQRIAGVTGFTEKQVCNWFKNRRQREKRKASATRGSWPRRGGGGRKRKRNFSKRVQTSFATSP
ncbi:hypothetical protein HNY73_021449 [Argiope bruennichi]|uniref:Homeobox domain-containing protein n=1 Tax=Argiope bruennichi TaxID=94029 RepID=A0A8T0DZK6_ARGBR|nr:hypothetical protein HNY73_021449 [Argiope bruennichi]